MTSCRSTRRLLPSTLGSGLPTAIGFRLEVPCGFMTQGELSGFLAQAGFEDTVWYGNWDRSPISATSPEIIAIAR